MLSTPDRTRATPDRFTEVFFKIIAACVGLLAGLAGLEAGVRLLGIAPQAEAEYGNNLADPQILYRPKPFSRAAGRNSTNEFDYDYRHNSLGFRDVEHVSPKPTGTFRILGLGDSFTYGAGVPFEEIYLSRLEAMLNHRTGAHPRVEIIKAGIPRYFPQTERLLLEQYGPHFQPDLVTVAFLPNDVIDTFMGMDAVTVDPSGFLVTREAQELGPWAVKAYEHCQFCRILLKHYVDRRIAEKYPFRTDDVFRPGGFHEGDWIAIENEYARMKSIASSMGARFMILHIPQKGPWTEREHYPGVRLSSWAKANKVGFVDVLPSMENASPGERLYYAKDGHCTPAGHRVIAQELYSYLTGQNLIP